MSVKDKSKPPAPADLAKRMTDLVEGRTIVRVLRADPQEVAIELDDGSRVFVRTGKNGLDLSVT